MILRPPRSTLDRSSAASDVYKRQVLDDADDLEGDDVDVVVGAVDVDVDVDVVDDEDAVSYTYLRAHETVLDLVCRLLLEQKQTRPRHTMATMRHYRHVSGSEKTHD